MHIRWLLHRAKRMLHRSIEQAMPPGIGVVIVFVLFPSPKSISWADHEQNLMARKGSLAREVFLRAMRPMVWIS